MGLAVVWSVFSGTCVQVAGLAPACSLECIKHKHVLQHVSHAVPFSRRIRLAMGNVSVCARPQGPNSRDPDELCIRKGNFHIRTGNCHMPQGLHVHISRWATTLHALRRRGTTRIFALFGRYFRSPSGAPQGRQIPVFLCSNKCQPTRRNGNSWS